MASLVRDPLPDPESVGEDEVLVERLRATITTEGPISFARFMARALYEPGHGYYRRPDPGPGTAGDFLTAPETHPIFGAAVGRLLEEAWTALGRPVPFAVVEHGAGTGALAEGLLVALRDAGSPLFEAIRYRAVEVELARLEALRARLDAAGLGPPLGPRSTPATPWRTARRPSARSSRTRCSMRCPSTGSSAVRAASASSWWGSTPRAGSPGSRRTRRRPSSPSASDDEGIELEDGQAAEVCLGVETWLAGAVDGLDRGVVVLVDYAEEPASLYAPRRRDGTLRGFARHGVGGDPFRHLGRQDLTATVDLAAVRAAAALAGLEPVGETTQAELLAATSGDLAASILHRPGATIEDALLLRSALARLLDPRGMGGYRVLVFGRGLPAGVELPGLRRLQAPGRPQPGAPG